MIIVKNLLLAFLLASPSSAAVKDRDTLPPPKDGKAPETFEELWTGFDPRKEPLDVEILHEWEQDGVVMKVLRYRVGIFKGKKAMMAAVYGYPKGGSKLPALVQIHGGGGSGTEEPVLANAKEGYATISIAWDGRIRAKAYPIDNQSKQLFWEGKTDHPDYRKTTDWGDLQGFFYPRRYQDKRDPAHHLDALDSPRNSSWFLWTIGARRAITFLERQPEVDREKIGVYGHSMGGELTIAVAGSDPRVKAASPSCGGITYKSRGKADEVLSSRRSQRRISCPILFLMASNDFNGRIHDLPPAVERLKSKEWRVVSAPHRNHSAEPAHHASVTLWFDQFLKGGFIMPETPKTKLALKTEDGTPVFTVTPDTSRRILSVDVYYTQQDESNYTERLVAMAKYWQHAPARESNGTWTARLPVFSPDRQLWVYADISYANDRYVHITSRAEILTSDTFNLSSLLRMATSKQLKASGVKATEKPSLVIESFQDGWEKEWFPRGQQGRATFKLRSLQYQAPPDARLGIEIRSGKTGRLMLGIEKGKDRYHHSIKLNGDSTWHQVVLSPSDFKKGKGGSPKGWDDLNISISPTAVLDWDEFELRNLRWIK